MFDALKVRKADGFIVPQVPQRGADETPARAMDALTIGMLGGTVVGIAWQPKMSAGRLALLGGVVWGASRAATAVSFGEPHDYFGRENAPSLGAYRVVGLVAGLGSTWAFEGLWRMWKAR